MNANILLTSVGRRVELARAFRRAYQRLGIGGHIVATDIDILAPALQQVDIPALVPPNRDPTYISKIAELCSQHDIDMVLPLIDPDIPCLARARHQIESTGAKLAVVDNDAADICGDKWLANMFFDRLGLSAPRSWLPGQLNPGDANFPLFIKPRDGSAAQHTFKASDAKEFAFFEQYVPNPIIQQFLDGPEITSDVVCDLEGNVLTVICRQRIAVRGGEVIKAVTVHDERIISACHKIAQSLPAIGPITVQCILHEGQPHFIEINARLGGGIPLAFAAGIDVPAILLSIAAGLPVDPLLKNGYVEGLHMTRFDESFFLSAAQVEANELDSSPHSNAK